MIPFILNIALNPEFGVISAKIQMFYWFTHNAVSLQCSAVVTRISLYRFWAPTPFQSAILKDALQDSIAFVSYRDIFGVFGLIILAK